MYNSEEILADREKRGRFVARAAQSGDVITVKANIPGADKRIGESFLIVRYFVIKTLEVFKGSAEFYDGADGYCAVLSVSGENLKERAVELEKNDPVGRFTDIDVYLQGSTHSLSRGYMRRCYICGNTAFVCARRRTHTAEELLNTLKGEVRAYFGARLAEIIKESLMAELDLENKFGLVTPTSNGSHPDLDYGIMQRAQDAIIPSLVRLFWIGFGSERTDGLLKELRPVGLEAENAMFAAVQTNTYKGFIFVAGLLLAAAGYALKNSGKCDIYSIIKEICRGITEELKLENQTFGGRAYGKYRVTGVRGHAENGFPAVRAAEEEIDDTFSSESLLAVLCRTVGRIEDTVLLKRAGNLENYYYFKEKISELDVNDEKRLQELNSECVKKGISIGGSADVLAAAVMVKKLKRLCYFE